MERVQMMDCGDTYRRADNGCFGKGPVIKTADYTIKALETGTIFSNSGAAGAVIFTLPTPKAGMWFAFNKKTQQNLVVSCPAGVSINGGTAGQVYKNIAAEANKTLLIVAVGATDYQVLSETGTWANAAS